MHFFLVLTNECNLECRYCLGCEPGEIKDIEIDYSIPSEIAYNVEDLQGFLSRDPDPTLILYGGEPLLRINKIKEIMDHVPAKYMLQTNGLLLKDLGRDYLLQLENVMLSIDGRKRTTDANRGVGVYDSVISAAKHAREQGFGKEIIARMTVARGTDIYKEVTHLLSISEFTSVHWQLDAGFRKEDVSKFSDWMRDGYNPGITRLVDMWIDQMGRGNVLRIYPFIGITKSLLELEPSKLRCGAGWAQYAILTDGRIAPCPVMGGLKGFYVGDIWKSDPTELREVSLGTPCSGCEILLKCGGRCLYSNKTKLWGEGGFREICSTAKHLISELERNLPEIQGLIEKGTIKKSEFEHAQFNSCEIIP